MCRLPVAAGSFPGSQQQSNRQVGIKDSSTRNMMGGNNHFGYFRGFMALLEFKNGQH